MPGRQPLNRHGTRYVAYPEDRQAKAMRQDRWFELEKEQERQKLRRSGHQPGCRYALETNACTLSQTKAKNQESCLY
jgi:hypothetical protein